MEKINETHVTFGYLKDPRLPEDISVSPASLEKKASSVGGIAVFVGAMAANLFGESEGAVISPALIAEKLNDKSHGIEAKTGVFEPSVKIQPFEWESFLASSGPDPEGNSSETPPVFPPSGDVWMTEDGKHSAPVYVPSLDALSTCGVDPEAKNICPTDKELIERGLMPEGQDKNENLAPFVHPDTRMAGNTEKSAGKASPLKQPENQDPEPTFDPEATPATAPEVGAVISNIAQHVGDGLAEGKKYEIRAMDEGVMFRDKAAWKSGETTKQTDWWEVIRVEGDFLLGKDNQGNEFWVSANGDSEATHLDIRPAKLTDEDLGKEEVPVKDVAEPEVSGEQAKISIDIEKLNQIIKEPMKVIGTQSLYEDSGRQHTVSSTDGRTEIQIASLKKARIMFDGEIRVLVEALVDGKIYIKKSDGKGMIGWMSLPGLDESEMAGLSVDELPVGSTMRDVQVLQAKKFAEANKDEDPEEVKKAIEENTDLDDGIIVKILKGVGAGIKKLFGGGDKTEKEDKTDMTEIDDILNSF